MPRYGGDSPFDDAVSALASPERRRLLVALLEHNPQEEITIPEAVHMGDRELEDLRNGFFHDHLPVLESLGVIEWNEDEHTVSKGPQFAEIRPMLELLDEHRDELPDGWV